MVINMHEAKSRLSELVDLARQGRRIIIARSGVPVADLVPHREPPQDRIGGQWRGRARVAPDFDASMEELTIRSRHAIGAAALPPPHRDPFDRMLVPLPA